VPFASNLAFPQPVLTVRVGGLGMQLLWGGCHALAHVSVAVSLLLVLELGVEMCIRHEGLGQEGLHSLYRQVQLGQCWGVRVTVADVSSRLLVGWLVIKCCHAVFSSASVDNLHAVYKYTYICRVHMCSAWGEVAYIYMWRGMYGLLTPVW
jgi:hypothetical protein